LIRLNYPLLKIPRKKKASCSFAGFNGVFELHYGGGRWKQRNHIIQLTMEQEGSFLELKRDPGLTKKKRKKH